MLVVVVVVVFEHLADAEQVPIGVAHVKLATPQGLSSGPDTISQASRSHTLAISSTSSTQSAIHAACSPRPPCPSRAEKDLELAGHDACERRLLLLGWAPHETLGPTQPGEPLHVAATFDTLRIGTTVVTFTTPRVPRSVS